LNEITNESDLENLTLLGSEAKPARVLEIFPNHHQGRDYTVTLVTGEFTCLCPKTGQPDFASITIKYTPDESLVESKSLKLYLASFRNEGTFHEHVTNLILDDLVQTMAPRWCKVSAEFAVRGGIAITVDAEYKKAVPAPPRLKTVDEPEKPRRTVANKRTGDDNYRPPPTRWERERERSRPEKKAYPPARESQGEKSWPEKRDYRPEQDKRWPEKDEHRPEQDKRWPAQGGPRPEGEYKRSERKTTKSLGETRTWRKRT
jgi:7-cyano-7-deazaguanine reductase